jgi:tetrahydromethanopterin S-methyltransferase subunit F
MIPIVCGFFFALLLFINKAYMSNEPDSFLGRHPALTPIFKTVKDITGSIISFLFAVLTTEKLLYKFPRHYSL